jgi:hypothetical protein
LERDAATRAVSAYGGGLDVGFAGEETNGVHGGGFMPKRRSCSLLPVQGFAGNRPGHLPGHRTGASANPYVVAGRVGNQGRAQAELEAGIVASPEMSEAEASRGLPIPGANR